MGNGIRRRLIGHLIGHSLRIHTTLIVSVAIVGGCGVPPETGTSVSGLSCESQCEAEQQACLQEGTVLSVCDTQGEMCIDSCDVETSAEVVKSLSVLRASHVAINTTRADQLLASATRVLKDVDSSDDLSCDVRLRRTGSIAIYDGDGIIADKSDLDRILDFPGNVKVVASIHYCRGTMGSFAGCARTPGTSFAVTRISGDNITTGGQVWAHEHGHNSGLSHRLGPDNLMSTPAGRGVRQFECDAFRNNGDVEPLALRAAQSPPPIEAALHDEPLRKNSNIDVADFVRAVYVGGVPFDEASSYGAEAVPILVSMLSNRQEMANWHNIVVTLGMIGDARAVDTLIAFVSSGGPEVVSDDVHLAKINTLLALGYIVNASGDKRALAYLVESLDPAVWTDSRGLKWVSPLQAVSDRDVHLATMAVIGLAVSGHVEAGRVLHNFKSSDLFRRFQASMNGVVEQALIEHAKVAGMGLYEYYGQ
jgi:hypothetical protein